MIATRGMVASSQTLASEAGLRILRAGGNAFDAAVAVAAALNVCEPTSTGIGGDAFALCYHASSKDVTAVVGGGASPAALTLDLCRQRGHLGTEIAPSTDALCVVVPGACAAWEDVVTRHGRASSPSATFSPRDRARRGRRPHRPGHRRALARQEPLLEQPARRACSSTTASRAVRGRRAQANPQLAATFRRRGARREEGSTAGPSRRRSSRRRTRGRRVDARGSRARTERRFPAPMSTTYRDDVRVWELPPPNHGVAALLALNCLEAQTLPGQALRRR